MWQSCGRGVVFLWYATTVQKNIRISAEAYSRVTALAKRTGLSRAKVIELLSHTLVEELIELLALRADVDLRRLAAELGLSYPRGFQGN